MLASGFFLDGSNTTCPSWSSKPSFCHFRLEWQISPSPKTPTQKPYNIICLLTSIQINTSSTLSEWLIRGNKESEIELVFLDEITEIELFLVDDLTSKVMIRLNTQFAQVHRVFALVFNCLQTVCLVFPEPSLGLGLSDLHLSLVLVVSAVSIYEDFSATAREDWGEADVLPFWDLISAYFFW